MREVCKSGGIQSLTANGREWTRMNWAAKQCKGRRGHRALMRRGVCEVGQPNRGSVADVFVWIVEDRYQMGQHALGNGSVPHNHISYVAACAQRRKEKNMQNAGLTRGLTRLRLRL
jgi:hypothetical protein